MSGFRCLQQFERASSSLFYRVYTDSTRGRYGFHDGFGGSEFGKDTTRDFYGSLGSTTLNPKPWTLNKMGLGGSGGLSFRSSKSPVAYMVGFWVADTMQLISNTA